MLAYDCGLRRRDQRKQIRTGGRFCLKPLIKVFVTAHKGTGALDMILCVCVCVCDISI